MIALHGLIMSVPYYPMSSPLYSFFYNRLPFFPFTYNYFYFFSHLTLESQKRSMYNENIKGQS